MPIHQEYGISKLVIQVGDNVIEGKILEKQKAQEKYDDAVASGHTAAIAQEDAKNMMRLTIGNILPNQEVTVHLQLIHILKVEGGAYCLIVPTQYFPTFDDQNNEYNYHYLVDIYSDVPITYISYP